MSSRRHREAVGEPVLTGAVVTETERAPQGCGLPFGQRRQVISDRVQQRVQACEAKLGFGLYPGRPQDPHGPGPAGGIIGQRRLPDTGIAPQHKHPAAAGRGLLKQLVDVPLLGLPAHEQVGI